MEYYFGQTNYKKDKHLWDLEGYDKWIALHFINDFPKMRKFQIATKDLANILRLSTVVDISESIVFDEPTYYIRKKALQFDASGKLSEFMGFNFETIKELSKE